MDLPQSAVIEQAVHLAHVLAVQVELTDEQVQHFGAEPGLHL